MEPTTNVLNSAEKIYVGDQEIKTVYSNNEKKYQKFDILFKFGSNDFEIIPDFSTLTHLKQTTEYLAVSSIVTGASNLFSGYFTPTVTLSGYDEYFIRMSRTTNSTLTSLFGRSGGNYVIEFFSQDFIESLFLEGFNFQIGHNKALSNVFYNLGNPDIFLNPIENVMSFKFIAYTGNMNDTYLLYDFVGVKY